MELMHILPRIRGTTSGSSWLLPGNYTEMLRQWPQKNAWFGTSDMQGFIPVAKLQTDHLAWTDFVLRSKRAAVSGGFSKDHGAKITAAIGEIYGNVIDHSQNTETAYVAYSVQAARFEFVVADFGVGILKSLQRNPLYADLSDAGSALELALREGVSRFSDPAHGFGFRPLLIGLANISRTVRFRSGNYGRLLTRLESGAIEARTVQLASIEGLFCTVCCDLDMNQR